jgi:hypothetical protein
MAEIYGAINYLVALQRNPMSWQAWRKSPKDSKRTKKKIDNPLDQSQNAKFTLILKSIFANIVSDQILLYFVKKFVSMSENFSLRMFSQAFF